MYIIVDVGRGKARLYNPMPFFRKIELEWKKKIFRKLLLNFRIILKYFVVPNIVGRYVKTLLTDLNISLQVNFPSSPHHLEKH
jgi:hypothetical protein